MVESIKFDSSELVELYRRVRIWYQKNINEIGDDESGFSEISKGLVRNLPPPEDATILEMRAVMREVISGGMEWAYNASDGQSTMSEYAMRAVEPFGVYTLTREEDDQLRTSVLWPFLKPGRATYYRILGENLTRDGNYTEAEVMIRRGFEYINYDIDRFDLNLALGNLFLEMDNIDEGIKQLENTLKIASDLNDPSRLIKVNTSLGKGYAIFRLNDMAESNFLSALSVAEEMYGNDQSYLSIYRQTLTELRNFYIETNNLQQAEEIQEKLDNLSLTPPSATQAEPNLTHSTPKSITDIFTQIDHLGYENFSRTIATLITHEETSLPLTIGIKAAWGAGKTSIMKMVQHILDADAEITQENEAIRRNRDQTSKLSYKKMFSKFEIGVREEEEKSVQPKESELGKYYSIPPRITVWFNAWKYQNSEQIWAGLAHCIISQVTARMTPQDRESFWLNLNLKRIDTNKIRANFYKKFIEEYAPTGLTYGALLLLQILVTVAWFGLSSMIPGLLALGISAYGIADFFRSRSKKLEEEVTGYFKDILMEPDYKGKTGFLHLVEQDIREVLNLVTKNNNPLVIFIDDLDRCLPNKVAEVVEAINLFLAGDYPNCVFVIGMEPLMVASALEVANKDWVLKCKEIALVEDQAPMGWRFMEKIIQLPLVIPMPTDEGLENYINHLVGSPETLPHASDFKDVFSEDNQVKLGNYMNELNVAENISAVVDMSKSFLSVGTLRTRADRDIIIEASKRMYTRKFTDRDPVIKELIESVAPILESNPRQLKRYTNLFRFLSTLRYYITLDNPSSEENMPSDEDLAKFVSLSLQWPQSIDCLRKMHRILEEGEEKTVSMYSILKKKAHELDNVPIKQRDKDWADFLKESGYNFNWMKTNDFRYFLTTKGNLDKYYKSGIW